MAEILNLQAAERPSQARGGAVRFGAVFCNLLRQLSVIVISMPTPQDLDF